ncbi:hypothetical protein AZ044_004790 [Pluralibacter gergoviae]|nr:hypothetical protein AZ034_001458 [Pluralibacter gergoviae]OUF49549.1 hypothetical protein AZ044_004790 [Pluralibacter gergoviae]
MPSGLNAPAFRPVSLRMNSGSPAPPPLLLFITSASLFFSGFILCSTKVAVQCYFAACAGSVTINRVGAKRLRIRWTRNTTVRVTSSETVTEATR